MVNFAATMTTVALLSSYSVAQTQHVAKPLPFDGRAQDVTIKTVSNKYSTHIFTMRNNSALTVKDYLKIDPKCRNPAYNGDTGVFKIGVDGNAIFKSQFNFRRTELAQFIATNKAGITFFRFSLMKDEPFLNPYAWEMVMDEHHHFDFRVTAMDDPPILSYVNGATFEAPGWVSRWNTTFVYGTWYNFGVALKAGPSGKGHIIDMYMSEGNNDLEHKTTHSYESDVPDDIEFHFGLLTLSLDGSQPKMNKKQDVISISGVSVTTEISTAATCS
ncbi:putative glycoside hydrolase 131, catalytic [Plasmopara halstedii]